MATYFVVGMVGQRRPGLGLDEREDHAGQRDRPGFGQRGRDQDWRTRTGRRQRAGWSI